VADITAANITGKKFNVCGALKMWCATVKGDGSGTTLNVPFSSVVAMAIGNIDDTGGVPAASFASGVVTYAAAPGNNESHYLTIWGF
jgi:hypothetical protein